MDGSIHAGPNAVLSMKREGYRKSDFSWRDLSEVMTYPGFWKFSSRYYREGMQEMYRSWSKAAFTRDLQRLVPEVQADDLIPSQNGVRAQALLRDGTMVDDFLLLEGRILSTCAMLLRPQPRLRWRSPRGSPARCLVRAGSRWSKWLDGAPICHFICVRYLHEPTRPAYISSYVLLVDGDNGP